MKKLVVTGGSGFIGSNLVKFLLNKKYFVKLLPINPEPPVTTNFFIFILQKRYDLIN